MTIGVGITTRNRPELAAKAYAEIKKFTPGAKIVLVDDASDEPVANADYRFEANVGIAKAKNKCLELLDDCDHIFLFDDDTHPTTLNWWSLYVASREPHLMFNFEGAPDHWKITQTYMDRHHVGYDYPRGCMLYVERRVLDMVGGLHVAFGKHGFEHEDWSRRIYEAGLTTQPFMDVKDSAAMLYCADQDQKGISSVSWSDHQAWREVDRKRLTTYADYRESRVPVIVARRDDKGNRDRIWRMLKRDYWLYNEVFKIYEGYQGVGPFNRAAGLNMAARMAGNWDVALFVDSDAYVPAKQITEALNKARETGKLVSAFTRVVELNQDASEDMLADSKLKMTHNEAEVERYRTEPILTQSLILAVPRALFERVHGFDENFVGWGGEDNAFWKACQIAGGEVLRVDGDVYHIWHEIAPRGHQRTNNGRWMLYNRARTLNDIKVLNP